MQQGKRQKLGFQSVKEGSVRFNFQFCARRLVISLLVAKEGFCSTGLAARGTKDYKIVNGFRYSNSFKFRFKYDAKSMTESF